LKPKFLEAAGETVSNPSLSIDDIVRIYMEVYCEEV